MVVGIALNIAPAILPYTDYQISQGLARVLFWTSIAALLLGIIFIIIALIRYKQKASQEQSQKGNLGDAVANILNKIHQRDLELQNSAKKQYLALFSLKDFKEVWDNYGITQNEEVYESIKVELGEEKLKEDKIQRRKQFDDLQRRLDPISKPGGLKESVRLASFLEQFPKTQDDKYQGIGKRRETDKKCQTLFRLLNSLRLEHAQVFADKELAQMIDEYFDYSKVAANVIMWIALNEEFVPSDVVFTDYLVSGIEDSDMKISNRITGLIEDISRKTTELERQQYKEDKTENHNEL